MFKGLSSVTYLILFVLFTFLFLHEFLFIPFLFNFSILEYIHLGWLGFWSIFLAIIFLGLFLRKAYTLNTKKTLLIIGGSILLVFVILLILLLSVAGQL
ncbi:magnesium-transporting ATPase (P-type) [Priestia megaterium]